MDIDFYTVRERSLDEIFPWDFIDTEMCIRDRSGVVPRDREQFRDGLNPGRMLERLKHGQTYTFSYSMDDNGDIRTKNITVAPIDLRLGRVCLSRTDITDSIREQQRLLRVIAYTCELAGFIDAASGSFIMYTRDVYKRQTWSWSGLPSNTAPPTMR